MPFALGIETFAGRDDANRLWLGSRYRRILRGTPLIAEPLLVIGRAATAFDTIGIRYAIGGSVASSLYGIPRATQDVDVVAEIYGKQVPALARKLADEFYADEGVMMDAVMGRASFNIVRLATLFKVDVFVHSREPWQLNELARAKSQTVGQGDDAITLKFASAEDTCASQARMVSARRRELRSPVGRCSRHRQGSRRRSRSRISTSLGCGSWGRRSSGKASRRRLRHRSRELRPPSFNQGPLAVR